MNHPIVETFIEAANKDVVEIFLDKSKLPETASNEYALEHFSGT